MTSGGIDNIDVFAPGGFVKTAEGYIRRPHAHACPAIYVPTHPSDAGASAALPRPAVDAGADALGTDAAPPTSEACVYDTDCTERDYGRCDTVTPGRLGRPGTPYHQCSYGCVEDSDCGVGNICFCGDTTVGRCVPASCTDDTDCWKPSTDSQLRRCLLETMPDPCGGDPRLSFGCAMQGTECSESDPCSGSGEYCSTGNCVSGPVCGRPFLVDGAERTAVAIRRADFMHAVSPRTSALTADDRAALAAHWTEVALMEHASIAAFARFSLELLSFGAPADLIEAANSALGDELEHARLAFGLASAYRGENVGPGPLSVDRALAHGGFIDVVRNAFLEACVGETCAAVEAAETLHWARDPAVRRVLNRIAADEMRHASLGYRFVQWALESSPPSVRTELVAMLRRELAALTAEPPRKAVEETETALSDHGLLSDGMRRASRALAIREVVLPTVSALLGGAGQGETAAAA